MLGGVCGGLRRVDVGGVAYVGCSVGSGLDGETAGRHCDGAVDEVRDVNW